MAHDGNTQRDTVPRLSDPADGGRSTEAESPRKSAGSPDQPLDSKPPKVLPTFNMVPRPGGAKKSPAPEIPLPPLAASERTAAAQKPAKEPSAAAPTDSSPTKEGEARRAAKRRPAAPPRARIAANDDAPSIGGLIFALQQKPSNRAFMLAAAGSGGWLAVGSLLAWAMLSPEIARTSFLEALARPFMIIVAATIFLPIALF